MTAFFAPERFATSSFLLRSYDAGDGPLLAEAHIESYEHLRPWMSWATPHVTVDEAELRVRRFRAHYLLNQDFVIGIFSPDEKRLLGGTGFHLREGPVSSGCAEMGMFIRASEAGTGLGTRVLEAMLRWGFGAWAWQRLSWRCDQKNVASVRVAEKAGLCHEGVLRGQAAEVGEGRRDTVCYGLTRRDWLDRYGKG